MSQHTRRKVVLSGVAGLATLALPPIVWAVAPLAHFKAPLFGDKNASKRLVVWGSYTCWVTARLIGTLKTIVSDLKPTVSLEWRHFPIHPVDPALHVAGLGFSGDHFWGFMLRVMDDVVAAGGSFEGLTPEKLAEFAKAEGGSAETLKAAYANKAKWAAVKEDMMAGKLLGVITTPGLFYNGYFLTPGGLPSDLKAFDASLRAMLKAG